MRFKLWLSGVRLAPGSSEEMWNVYQIIYPLKRDDILISYKSIATIIEDGKVEFEEKEGIMPQSQYSEQPFVTKRQIIDILFTGNAKKYYKELKSA